MMDEKSVYAYIAEIYQNSRMSHAREHIQHGTTAVPLHCAAVAVYSDRLLRALNRWFGTTYRQRELIRGALLHDYFLYDWHDGDPARKVHGFTHPGIACENAQADFDLTEVEQDIIRRHMFPLTLRLPRHREGLVVCLVDKICSIYEVFAIRAYKGLAGALGWPVRTLRLKRGEQR